MYSSMETTPSPDNAPISTATIDQARGVQLALIVGRIFGIVAPSVFLASVLFTPALLSIDYLPALTAIIAAALIACGLIWGGTTVATRGENDWAGRMIVTGMQLAFFAAQAILIWGHGLTPILLTSLMIHIMPIGLAYVLSGLRLLFITSGVTTVFTALLVFGLAPLVDPHFTLPQVLGSWIIATLIAWMITLLVFASALTYNQALNKLGALQVAFERAQQLDALKDQFITHVNHELRTPIMTLQGTIDFLYDARQTMTAAQTDTVFGQARRSADRLVMLLSGILDVRNIEQASGPSERSRVNVAETLAHALELVDPLGQHTISRSIPDDLAIWGDAGYLQQILVNLLSNAIKYAPDQTPIEVVAERFSLPKTPSRKGPIPAEMVEIRVRDFGLGIPSEQIPLLFNRFVRLQRDLASNVPGSGVGLFICKLLAERLGGTIGVESAGIPGEGTTFIVHLPYADATPTITTAKRAAIGARS